MDSKAGSFLLGAPFLSSSHLLTAAVIWNLCYSLPVRRQEKHWKGYDTRFHLKVGTVVVCWINDYVITGKFLRVLHSFHLLLVSNKDPDVI